MKSRKARLLIWIIAVSTILAFAPPLLCWLLAVLKYPVPPLMLMTDGDWITIVGIIIPSYMGSITWEKHIALSNGVPIQSLDQTVMQIKANTQFTPATQQTQNIDPDKDALKDQLTHSK